MSQSQDGYQQTRVLNLMLIEDDPVFRIGLLACLKPFSDLQVVLEADSTAEALERLRTCRATDLAKMTTANEPIAHETAGSARSLDLILLNLDIGQVSNQGIGLALCQQIRTEYPQVPLLLLGATLELTRLAAAFQSGADGYCLKGTGIAELVTAIRQVAAGQAYWADGIPAMARSMTPSKRLALDPSSASRSANDAAVPRSRRWLGDWRRKLRLTGVHQIERAIAALELELQVDRSVIDQFILAGQRRELRAARWLVERLLASSSEPIQEAWSEQPPVMRRALSDDRPRQATPSASTGLIVQATVTDATALTDPIASGIPSPQAALFQTTRAKLHGNLQNVTATALEIDILKDIKKQALLQIVLRQLQTMLESLRSQLPLAQLEKKRDVILQDVWQAAVTEFFGKYYTVSIEAQSVEVVSILLQEADTIEAEMLANIPLFPEFLAHLLFQTPLMVEDATVEAGSVEAMARMELLLHNMTIQIANAVMQPLLNRFGSVTEIKQTFYNKRLLSNREIERFRNDLSWKYRTNRVFAEPAAIFESRYNLLTLTENGISKTTIYAPRNAELAALCGLPFLVTFILEIRDAIVPRLRAAIAFLGRGVVYVLTEVIGRGIGLIGRGILKGIGNALQEPKPTRNSERWR